MPRLLVFFALFILTSCGPLLHDVTDDIKLLEAFRHNQEKIHSFRGIGRVFLSLGGQKGSLEAIVVLDRKDHLRIETGNFFGNPLSALTIDGDKITYYVIPEEKYYVGFSEDQVLEKIMPLELNKEDLQGIIYFSQPTYEQFKKSKRYTLEFFSVQENDRFHLYYPKGFKLTDLKTKDFMELKWGEYDLNPSRLPDILFKIDKPPQARLIPLSSSKKFTPLFKGDEDEE